MAPRTGRNAKTRSTSGSSRSSGLFGLRNIAASRPPIRAPATSGTTKWSARFRSPRSKSNPSRKLNVAERKSVPAKIRASCVPASPLERASSTNDATAKTIDITRSAMPIANSTSGTVVAGRRARAVVVGRLFRVAGPVCPRARMFSTFLERQFEGHARVPQGHHRADGREEAQCRLVAIGQPAANPLVTAVAGEGEDLVGEVGC